MKHWVLEATPPLTRMEVKDWLYKSGLIAYQVNSMPSGSAESTKCNRFHITTSDSAAQRALAKLPGQKIGQSIITVHLDDLN